RLVSRDNPGDVLNINPRFCDQCDGPMGRVAQLWPFRRQNMVATVGTLACSAGQTVRTSPSLRLRQLRSTAAILVVAACIGVALPSVGWAQSAPAQDVEQQQGTAPWVKSETMTV